ncbi:OsmC family protein [Flavobacterium pedocola]
MNISATLKNSFQRNDITVKTENAEKSITIPSKAEGFGSSVNGGEMLFLALATCFCNDLYREAAKRKMTLDAVDVTVSGTFGKEGEPAVNISYTANVKADNHSESEIAELIQFVDSIAEIHATLRKGINVVLNQ